MKNFKLLANANSPPIFLVLFPTKTILKPLTMKTVKTFLLLSLTFCFTSQAQITKGNFLVGGNAFFQNSNAKNAEGELIQSSNFLRVQPNIAYFPANNFATGMLLIFTHGKTAGNSNPNTFYGIGPYIRYYFLKSDKTYNILTQLDYSYGQDFGSPSHVNSYAVSAGPVIYFNSSVGLEFLLKYEKTHTSSDSYDYSLFQFGIGLQIHLEKN
jgi:hypothetical protein